jgi:hypothetical protein
MKIVAIKPGLATQVTGTVDASYKAAEDFIDKMMADDRAR